VVRPERLRAVTGRAGFVWIESDTSGGRRIGAARLPLKKPLTF